MAPSILAYFLLLLRVVVLSNNGKDTMYIIAIVKKQAARHQAYVKLYANPAFPFGDAAARRKAHTDSPWDGGVRLQWLL